MPIKRALSLLTILIATSLSTFSCSAETPAPTRHLQVVQEISPIPNGTKPAEKDLKGYLLVYFKDETHSIYFSTSIDGYTFTDVNGGDPILLGKDIAEQKGVRDPHLMRGPDNAFYLSMTDL